MDGNKEIYCPKRINIVWFFYFLQRLWPHSFAGSSVVMCCKASAHQGHDRPFMTVKSICERFFFLFFSSSVFFQLTRQVMRDRSLSFAVEVTKRRSPLSLLPYSARLCRFRVISLVLHSVFLSSSTINEPLFIFYQSYWASGSDYSFYLPRHQPKHRAYVQVSSLTMSFRCVPRFLPDVFNTAGVSLSRSAAVDWASEWTSCFSSDRKDVRVFGFTSPAFYSM